MEANETSTAANETFGPSVVNIAVGERYCRKVVDKNGN